MTQNEYIAALREALSEIRDSSECHEEWYKTIAREALALPVPSAWLPIETAPKDGAYNPVILFAECPVIGYWRTDANAWDGDDGWVKPDPTHWTPWVKPTPPESEA